MFDGNDMDVCEILMRRGNGQSLHCWDVSSVLVVAGKMTVADHRHNSSTDDDDDDVDDGVMILSLPEGYVYSPSIDEHSLDLSNDREHATPIAENTSKSI